jgi:hypothetical protein
VLTQIIKEPEVDKIKTERDSNLLLRAETAVKPGFSGSSFVKEYFTFAPCPVKKSTKGC